MTGILADYNVSGQAAELWQILSAGGWLDLWPIEFVTFEEIQLPADASDLKVWLSAQSRQLVLLTLNRKMNESESLEETLRLFNTSQSLPVLTIGNQERFREKVYREACAVRLFEIVSDIESYLGAGRIYIP